LDSTGPRKSPVEGSCKRSKAPLDSIKGGGGNFLIQLTVIFSRVHSLDVVNVHLFIYAPKGQDMPLVYRYKRIQMMMMIIYSLHDIINAMCIQLLTEVFSYLFKIL
jgi:hypothetical protein